jgi:hypothetical protein
MALMVGVAAHRKPAEIQGNITSFIHPAFLIIISQMRLVLFKCTITVIRV